MSGSPIQQPATHSLTRPAKMLAAAGLLAVSLGACSNMSSTQQRTLSGGAIGAAGGAAIGALSGGSAGMGALIGGAAGAGTGYLLSQ
ncbi:YMGG-like glycine zipper-containing protein [Dongia rigui]|uniref:YMGG-like glycine zipper-containing protein n=1 Tax=Dongia rigui TaxID=940149 RepID=A0ABU5E2Y8_9PROT|nr:YMGG-like glycine zipper-containing protein [Dongia rigui]MDY0873868.1 YMGG-like glycine zipper-containing protein [Dongia rigui]